MRVVLISLMMACAASQASFAQDLSDDPEERFFSLLDDFSLDDARDMVAEEYDDAVATDIAVYLCSPPADDDCPGSVVFTAWQDFLQGIDLDLPVADVVQDMQDYDAYLVNGIVVYWCSPEPGDGCGPDQFTQAWLDFESLTENNPNPADAISRISASAGPLVAELLAASVCGEATCYADELADFDFEQIEQFEQPDTEQQAKQQQTSDVQLANKLGSPRKGWKAKLSCWIRKSC